MKKMMNFTTSIDDVSRYISPEDLRCFFQHFGCNGLEVMPLLYPSKDAWLQPEDCPLIHPDMVIGVHLCCVSDWMSQERTELIEKYQRDLAYACHMRAEYVVFHVTQVSDEEIFTYRLQHTDEEVILAAAEFINELLSGQEYSFYFLMENLWWPGLNFLSVDTTRLLLDKVHYEKKGLMLDTGHFLHTNLELTSQSEALSYLNNMLETHKDLLPFIKGVHLHQSLNGSYVKAHLQKNLSLSPDPEVYSRQLYEHLFAIDQHRPFTASGVKNLIERIDPLFLTYEYISRSRNEHAAFLEAGRFDL